MKKPIYFVKYLTCNGLSGQMEIMADNKDDAAEILNQKVSRIYEWNMQRVG